MRWTPLVSQPCHQFWTDHHGSCQVFPSATQHWWLSFVTNNFTKTSLQSQKTVAVIFCTNSIFNFFGFWDPVYHHWKQLLLLYGVMWATLVSPPVTEINNLTAFFVIVCKKNIYRSSQSCNTTRSGKMMCICFVTIKPNLPRNHSANSWYVKCIQHTFNYSKTNCL